MNPYPAAVERLMKRLYRSLRESDRRRYAAIEATKLGYGGTAYIAGLLGCDPKTIRRGARSWKPVTNSTPTASGKRGRPQAGDGRPPGRVGTVRRGAPGPYGGRPHEPGCEVDQPVPPTDRPANEGVGDVGQPSDRRPAVASPRVSAAKARKKKTMGRHPDRNAQFENITRLKGEYLAAGRPVVSTDTKKKALLGDFYRDGGIDTQEAITTNDHDSPSRGGGKVIPHGLYDVGRNEGFVHLNTSHDTSELACDSIAAWWDRHGRTRHPGAKKLLLWCDGGGSNSATQYLFKEDLQRLARQLGLEIRVAHDPPYCSKYNPIEHRMFPHVSRACRGVVFHTVETVRHYMAKAETTAGLRVVVGLLGRVYAIGRKCMAGFKKAMKIVFDPVLPKWNYTALPEPP